MNLLVCLLVCNGLVCAILAFGATATKLLGLAWTAGAESGGNMANGHGRPGPTKLVLEHRSVTPSRNPARDRVPYVPTRYSSEHFSSSSPPLHFSTSLLLFF